MSESSSDNPSDPDVNDLSSTSVSMTTGPVSSPAVRLRLAEGRGWARRGGLRRRDDGVGFPNSSSFSAAIAFASRVPAVARCGRERPDNTYSCLVPRHKDKRCHTFLHAGGWDCWRGWHHWLNRLSIIWVVKPGDFGSVEQLAIWPYSTVFRHVVGGDGETWTLVLRKGTFMNQWAKA
jgi:hypothetical protein